MPLTLNIPDYLDAVDGRSAHNWRKVRYSYMDARRLANRVGLTIRGPQKIFDTRMASIALMFARGKPGFDRFVDLGFERFFKRELDIENEQVMTALREEAGSTTGIAPRLKSRACSACRRWSCAASCSGAATGSTWCASG